MEKLGRYQIVGEIGRGAMGVVYKAIDPLLNRTVAIKTMNMTLDPGEREHYEARFYLEAKAAGGLNHPNIVTLYDIGNTDNIAYMAMELIEGSELRDLLTTGQHLPIARAIDIIAQVAEGLAFAHERGVIHRDVKPSNIMVPREGPVKIMDFGIARLRTTDDVRTLTGVLMGSPKYMSPEQVLGKRADPRSDIFSLGVILYEMLTGALPFQGDSVTTVMYQTVNFAPPAPSELNREVPELLDFILAKMMTKQIDERYQSAKDVARDLRDCLRRIESGTAGAPGGPRPHAALAAGPSPMLVDPAAREAMLDLSLTHSRRDDSVDDAAAAALPVSAMRANATLPPPVADAERADRLSRREYLVLAASAATGLAVAAVIVLY